MILRPDFETFFFVVVEICSPHHTAIAVEKCQADIFAQTLCFQRYAATQSWRVITRAPVWRTTPRPANTRTRVPVPRPRQNSRPRTSNSRRTNTHSLRTNTNSLRTNTNSLRTTTNSRRTNTNNRKTKTNKRRNGRRRHHKKKPKTQVEILNFVFKFDP